MMAAKPGPRKAARLSGAKTYFTGVPCKQGHIADRNASSGRCFECVFPSETKENHRKWSANFRVRNPERARIQKYRYLYGIELESIRPKPETCECCGRKHRKIVLDHCHETGQFRGWVCDPCNVTFGLVKEDVSTLRQVILYLQKMQNLATFRQ